MGTRSVTVFSQHNPQEDDSQIYAYLYRQFDGYIDGHGHELATFLYDFKLVNGIPMVYQGKLANGIDNLAVQAVTHFAEGPSNFRLISGKSFCDAEYVYEVYMLTEPGFGEDAGEIGINMYDVLGGYNIAYKCTPQALFNEPQIDGFPPLPDDR